MLCQDCGKNPAQVFFKQIVNNQVAQHILCGDCASKKGIAAFDPNQLFLNLLSGLGALPPGAARAAPPKCPSCGLAFSQFRETGRLGCAGCYAAFRAPLEDLLRRIHGSTRHAGKRPPSAAPGGEASAPPRAPADGARLRRDLKAAIEREDFEEAARLRDRIRAAEGGTP